MTTPKDLLIRQLKFLNIDKYHEQGFGGEGIVVLNTEEPFDHGRMTNMVLKQFAPEVAIINGTIGGRTSGDTVIEYYLIIYGVKYDFEEAINKFKIKVITTSMSASTSNAVLKYLREIQERTGVIMFCSAGNDGTAGATGKYVKGDTAIAVGAAYIYENGRVEITHYSAIDDEVDFIAPMGTGSGTSAASPVLTAMTALLLQRYGDFNQKECVEILKSLCIDLGTKGKDQKYGWGLPVLPLTDKLEIIKKLRGEKIAAFKDVEENRWSKPAIDKCVAEGLLFGFEDGTFRPTEYVTREQMAAILIRILDKIV